MRKENDNGTTTNNNNNKQQKHEKCLRQEKQNHFIFNVVEENIKIEATDRQTVSE